MVVVFQCPKISDQKLSVFRTTDSRLSGVPIYVLYGLSTTFSASGGSNSRIQCHVLTPGGFKSYPRLAVSPNSPLYKAIECLPREDQGDEVCRGLAFALLKHFSELPETAKDGWIRHSSLPTAHRHDPFFFSALHAAELASRMTKVTSNSSVLRSIDAALSEQSVSIIDVDVVLPVASNRVQEKSGKSLLSDQAEGRDTSAQFAVEWMPLINLFGTPFSVAGYDSQQAATSAPVLENTYIFTKIQKEALRLEMCELFDTEDNYVKKLHELSEITATIISARMSSRLRSATNQNETDIGAVFLPCLKVMLDGNSQFLGEIRQILEDTENDAIEDIKSTPDIAIAEALQSFDVVVDATGVRIIAEKLLEWFQKFAKCYTQYIQSYADISSHFKMILNEHPANIGCGVQDTLNQRLMSLLIEPVQRLPRYNLYVDKIIKQLPVKHPALEVLNASKKVIAVACSQDPSSREQFKIKRLKQLISSWPRNFDPNSRLITVTDVEIVEPPYNDIANVTKSHKSMLLLLFAEYLVLVTKGSNEALAQSLMADVEKSQYLGKLAIGKYDAQHWDLRFAEYTQSSEIEFSEMGENSMIRILPMYSRNYERHLARVTSSFLGPSGVRTMKMQGAYQKKAKDWIGEAIKGRIEARLLDTSFITSNWTLRHYSDKDEKLQLLSTISTKWSSESQHNRDKFAPVRIFVDPEQHTTKLQAYKRSAEVLVIISSESNGFYRLNVEAGNDRPTWDLVTEAELMPVLTRRIGNSLQMRYQIRNPAAAECLISHNYSFLNSLAIQERHLEAPTDASKMRSSSPVKALTSLFTGNSSKDIGSLKKALPSIPVLAGIHHFPASTKAVKSLSEPDLTKEPVRTLSKILFPNTSSDHAVNNHIQALESTFSTYILALHARKGNVVGKVLANRAMADEHDVKALYEVMLNDPSDLERAAQTSVDVLFTAFEKFVKLPWKDVMGPIVDSKTLREMQTKADALNPYDHEDYMSPKMSELAPQNQRAFRAIIDLLVDLLGGMANDGDRGSLTAAIVEIVVCDDDPRTFIPLFDRLVADSDRNNNANHGSGPSTPVFGSLAPTGDRIVNGSTGSKSSLSKRFAFTSANRPDGKTEIQTQGSVARLWNRAGRTAEQSSQDIISPSKSGSLDRRPNTLMPIKSIEQSPVPHSYNEALKGTTRAVDTTMPILGQVDLGSPFANRMPTLSPKIVKKKRRSSLSDLKMNDPSKLPISFKTPTSRKAYSRVPDAAPQLPQPLEASPLSPSLVFTTALKTSTLSRSPTLPQGSASRMENTHPNKQKYRTAQDRAVGCRDEYQPLYNKKLPAINICDDLLASESSKLRKSPCLIPVPRAILTERKSSGNSMPPLKPSPFKPRLPEAASVLKEPQVYSPGKLSDLLQTQQKAIINTESSIYTEIEQLRNESSQFGLDKGKTQVAEQTSEYRNQTFLATNLGTRLKALESKVPHLIRNLQNQTTALEGHVSDLLLITEKKLKVLDVKLKQSNQENVALYERNNEEFMRVFEQVRDGRVIEELRAKLMESMREAEMWKRECRGLNRKGVNRGMERPLDAIRGGVMMAGDRLQEEIRTADE